MSVFVSIGRNIGTTDVAMRLEQWQRFVADTERAVLEHCGPIASVCEGKGYYEGKAEHCAIVVSEGALYHDKREAFVARLKDLCSTYHQVCVAVTVGNPIFVTL